MTGRLLVSVESQTAIGFLVPKAVPDSMGGLFSMLLVEHHLSRLRQQELKVMIRKH